MGQHSTRRLAKSFTLTLTPSHSGHIPGARLMRTLQKWLNGKQHYSAWIYMGGDMGGGYISDCRLLDMRIGSTFCTVAFFSITK